VKIGQLPRVLSVGISDPKVLAATPITDER